MGLDCSNVRKVIHIVAPENIEAYIQQAGRAGRDGKLCSALLYHGKDLSKTVDKDMQLYCQNNSKCKKQVLMNFYNGIDQNNKANDDDKEFCDICSN